ncbi:BTAD domain-containing putative transcriptional regulator [Tenggerimyces flavus]|uniref:BTAD domain-containing putative transcriptional regulator n=1 Tax=Tenggerimyces flavus TaxID=1708749 RepID=A0ABV7YLF8_9ACTN|nr:BTAD domain-containing putative transcriptional regulator [Tenggerimyces flavus]MBM7789946.1 DNA-binding SARP family transcriptional activator/tetratricopeptide (TPR) repeat protein [Tenggerimyces flavus]
MNEPSYRVLGPLQVAMNGSAVALGGVKPRTVLGTLLLSPHKPVSTDLLIDVLWPAGPPRSAIANIRTYLHALRGRLPDTVAIRTTTVGYVAEVAPDLLDAARFERLVHSARPEDLDEACGLWRGRVLEDLPGNPTWAPTIARLTELRLAAVERRAALATTPAQHEAAVAELRELLADHPLREGLWRQLMVALRRCGRTAEAMRAYADAEVVLRRELAVGPGQELRQLLEAIRGGETTDPTDEAVFGGQPMRPRDLVELLAGTVGRGRVDREPAAAEDIVRACDQLPLAVRAAANRLAARPHVSLRAYADRLRDERRRLDELRPVRTELRRITESLPSAARRALWMVSLFGPVQLPGWLVDAAGGREELVRARLLETVGESRYRLPDLVRCYGAELAREQPDRREGLAGVLQTWLLLADAARQQMPVRFFGTTPELPPGRRTPPADAMAWFEQELPGLVAAIEVAADVGCDELAWQLAATLAPYFDLTGGFDPWERSHRAGLEAARRVRDLRGQATLLRNLGQLDIYRDRYDAAATALGRSRTLFAQSGDQVGAAVATCGLATVQRVRGRYDPAIVLYEEALALLVAAGDQHGEAVALSGIGQVWLARGRPELAEPMLLRAYNLALALDDRHRQGQVLRRLAMMQRDLGRVDEALLSLRRALALFTELADEHCTAYVRQLIGELHLDRREPTRARPLLVDSLNAHRRSGDKRGEAVVATLLGELHGAAGRTKRARSYLRQARTLWQQLSAPAEEAAVTARLSGLRRPCMDRVSAV